MPSIKVLSDNLINKIAAGEVVERPASVVKELIENAIDAGATGIDIEVEQAGKRLMRVSDDGSGMSPDDARLAFERHATSKIASEEDLDAITTMGFRGEALASIAAVAHVRMVTCRRGDPSGTLLEVEGGKMRPAADAAASPGTSIEVRNLFFNTPARLKFLKSPSTELSHIITAVSHQAMAHAGVRFTLIHDGRTIYDLPASQSLHDRAFQIYGNDLVGNLIEFSGLREPARVNGLVGKPAYDRGDRSYQEFYVNGRYVRNTSLTHALYDACRDLIMRDRHPAAIVFLDLDPSLVDVNVHPAKAEVRFRNQTQVHDLVRDVIREALRGSVGRQADDGAGRIQEAIREHLDQAGPHLTRTLSPGGRGSVSQTPAVGEGATIRDGATLRLPVAASHGLVPLAQVHDSFIVAQDTEGMALIDQHAAHERVLFEKLQDQFAADGIPVQQLLVPLPVELGHAEQELLSTLLADLAGAGFAVEPFGGGTFMIKAVPALLTGGDHKRLLHDILDEVKAQGNSGRMDRMRDTVLSVMACHPAIKVHRKLSIREMEGLIRDLFACRMPHSCPHGRPTVVRFSMDEISRLFKRI